MKTLLVPTDFSDNATNALRYATALAKRMKARLLLVHVLPIPVMVTAESTAYTSFDPRLQKCYIGKLKALAYQLQLENASSLEVECYCEYGLFQDVLNRLVRSKQADLVVMGARGAGSLVEKALGTTASTFMKEAICPVVAVPSEALYSDLHRIAYASDFTGDEEAFLKQLFLFSEPLGAEVYIVHVKTKDAAPVAMEEDQLLMEVSAKFPDKKFSVAQVRARTVIGGIEIFLSDNQIGMLAVAVHERGFLQDLFHRSVSKRLALRTVVPLLSLPEKPYNLQRFLADRAEKTVEW